MRLGIIIKNPDLVFLCGSWATRAQNVSGQEDSPCRLHSFQFTASDEWVKLPHEIKLYPSLPCFKSKLYAHLLNQQNDSSLDDDNVCIMSCIDSVIDKLAWLCLFHSYL